MRAFIWSIVTLVVGVVIGLSIPKKHGKIAIKGSVNYVNIACLYVLSKKYEQLNGRLPTKLDELREWCNSDEIKRSMIDRVYYVHADSFERLRPWIILDQQNKNDYSDAFITSGIISSPSGVDFSIVLNRNGDIEIQQ